MNRISEAKRARQRKAKEEIERLRSEVRNRDEEIYRLQNETMVVDSQREWELEKEIRQLKEQLVQKGGAMEDEGRSTRETTVEVGSEMGNESQYEWTLAARDPFNNEYSDMCVDDDSIDIDSIGDNEDSAMDLHMPIATTFGDASMSNVASSTPANKQKPFASVSMESCILSPPATSPAATPSTLLPVRFDRMLPTPKSTSRLRYSTTTAATQADLAALTVEIGAQADMPDPEKQLLEEQMQSMRREMSKLNATIDTYESLNSRLGAKLDAALPSSPSFSPEDLDGDVEQRLTKALQELSDRTSAIATLSSSLSQLGFAGGDAFDVIASISGAFRSARLELEYLTPGEITLPLSASGAQVLDLLLTRLRDLAKRVKEADDSIDEYHSLELSLRQQLGARAEAMEKDAIERDNLKERLGERDERIAELEVSVSRLRGAVEGCERDIHELEALVERMEGEGNELRSEVHAKEQAEREKQQLIASLEERLAMVEAEAKKLAEAKDDAERRRVEDIAAMSRDHSVVLAGRDMRIKQLREEVERLNAKIAEGLENRRSLKEEKRDADREKDRAKRVVQEMQAQLQRVMIMGSSYLSSEMEGVQQKMEKEADDEMAGVPSGRYAKRRRFDSGIGVDDEEEDELAA